MSRPTHPIAEALDETSFTRLYQAHLDAVYNYIRYRTGMDEADDLTAEVFTKVWRSRTSWNPTRGSLETWMWAVVRNTLTDHLRRLKSAGTVASQLDEAIPGPQDPLLQEEWRSVQAALAKLPECDREIIALRFGAGLTNRAIASLLGMREANVAQHLRRALTRTRQRLAMDEGDLE